MIERYYLLFFFTPLTVILRPRDVSKALFLVYRNGKGTVSNKFASTYLSRQLIS